MFFCSVESFLCDMGINFHWFTPVNTTADCQKKIAFQILITFDFPYNLHPKRHLFQKKSVLSIHFANIFIPFY